MEKDGKRSRERIRKGGCKEAVAGDNFSLFVLLRNIKHYLLGLHKREINIFAHTGKRDENDMCPCFISTQTFYLWH